MKIICTLLLLAFAWPALKTGDPDIVTGKVSILRGQSVFTPDDPFKGSAEKPFHIEAVFETSPCSNQLVSIDVHNAHPPLTWYELDASGHKVHTLFNPDLNHFNDHTTYMVQDMSRHTDTIFIDFDQVLAIKRIHPNPHRGTLFIDYSAIEPEGMRITLHDMTGKTVMSETRFLSAGENRFSLDLESVGQGVYFLRLDGNCIRERLKIVHLE